MTDGVPDAARPKPRVRIVPLSLSTLTALADGDLSTAESEIGYPLSPAFGGLDWRGTWRRRARQVEADPSVAVWVTGAVVDLDRHLGVGRAGFHGPPDRRGMVEVGYAIAPEHRRRGYARAALEILLERAAREPAVAVVRASVRPDNVASLRLVADYRFRPVGEQIDDEDGLETIYEVETRHG